MRKKVLAIIGAGEGALPIIKAAKVMGVTTVAYGRLDSLAKEQVDFYHSFAKDNNLLETIGSDFHGKTKPSIHLGQSMADEDVENRLLEFFGDV